MQGAPSGRPPSTDEGLDEIMSAIQNRDEGSAPVSLTVAIHGARGAPGLLLVAQQEGVQVRLLQAAHACCLSTCAGPRRVGKLVHHSIDDGEVAGSNTLSRA